MTRVVGATSGNFTKPVLLCSVNVGRWLVAARVTAVRHE
jgi:hypothetical protein